MFEIEPKCPQCGSSLSVEKNGAEDSPEDRIFCPEHGTVGLRKDIEPHIVQRVQDEFGRRVSNDFEQQLKNIGFDVTRE